AEVRAIATSVAKGEKKGGAFIARLLDEVELWRDEGDEPYVTFTQDGHKEHRKVCSRSRPFSRWLCKRHYEMTGGGVLTAGERSDTSALLEGKAIHEGPRHPTFRRTAAHGGNFYLDLCDEMWRAVEIDKDGWRVVDNPPVRFLIHAPGKAVRLLQ